MNKTRIKGVEFIRDFGGIGNNQKTNYHLIYRTSKLTKIRAKSQQKIANNLNVNTIVDFRTEAEVDFKPDKTIDNVNYVNLPVLSNEDNPVVNKSNGLNQLKRIMKASGGVKGYMSNIYRKLISSDQAIEEYKKFLELVKNSDGSIIYHCTQGKDRTGIATAIILMALGIDEEAIKRDYLNYNKAHKLKRLAIFIGMTIVFFSVRKAIALHDLLIARIEYINAAFDEIKAKYGSINNYLHKTLGLSDADISSLKSKYLQK